MPCDIGYKSYATVEILAPQEFKVEVEAPAIDEDLLEKLGEEDAEFVEWAKELNTQPLLQEALKRALAKTDAGGISFVINDGGVLEAKGSFKTPAQKKALSERAAAVSQRWQFEILGIVTQLIGYSVTICQSGNTLTLEAEEEGKTHPCNYIKVTRTGEASDLTFEHFKSRNLLELETARFLLLAHRLGVKIVLRRRETTQGSPFPTEGRLANSHGHTHKTRED